jgi:tetratricopeptide (TPR) repeat protein
MKRIALHIKWIVLAICLFAAIFPGGAQAQSASAVNLVSRAQAAFNKGQYSQTIELCKRAIKISPRYARAYAWLGTAYGRRYLILSRDPAQKKAAQLQKQAAVAAFRKVLSLAPDSLDAKRAKAGLSKLADQSAPAQPLLQADPVWSVAETRVVSPRGDAPYTSINAAMQSAPANTRIIVKPGHYEESLVLTRPVQIIGEGDPAAIVVQNEDGPVLQMSTSKALVKGLSFQGEAVNNAEFHAVDIGMGRLFLEDCRIQTNSRSAVGIYNAASNPTLRRCIISGAKVSAVVIYAEAGGHLDQCDISGAGFANVEIRQLANPLLTHCTIHDGNSKGVAVHDRGYGYLLDCSIKDNPFAGLEVKRDCRVTLTRCKISGSSNSVWIWSGAGATLNRCDVTGAMHRDNGSHLWGSGNQTR